MELRERMEQATMAWGTAWGMHRRDYDRYASLVNTVTEAARAAVAEAVAEEREACIVIARRYYAGAIEDEIRARAAAGTGGGEGADA